jgi:hypothetical protein
LIVANDVGRHDDQQLATLFDHAIEAKQPTEHRHIRDVGHPPRDRIAIFGN